MKTRELVLNYFSKVMTIVNKMHIHGEKLEYVTIVEKILRSITLKFNYTIQLKNLKTPMNFQLINCRIL